MNLTDILIYAFGLTFMLMVTTWIGDAFDIPVVSDFIQTNLGPPLQIEFTGEVVSEDLIKQDSFEADPRVR